MDLERRGCRRGRTARRAARRPLAGPAAHDDPLAAREAGKWGGRIVTFSLESPTAKVWSYDVHAEGDGQVFTAYWQPKKSLRDGRAEIHLPEWGDHHRANALAAIAVGWVLGDVPATRVWINPEKLPGRVQTLTAGGVTIVDDTYNANPDSMRAALKAFETVFEPYFEGRSETVSMRSRASSARRPNLQDQASATAGGKPAPGPVKSVASAANRTRWDFPFDFTGHRPGQRSS